MNPITRLAEVAASRTADPLPESETLVDTQVEKVERRSGRRRRRSRRHLRNGLTRSQRYSLAFLIWSWAALTALAWAWWLEPSNSTSSVGLVINSLLLAIESLGLPLWFYYWIWRMRRPDPTLAPPHVRTAMVVTKAPSEPWKVVRETLQAMLAQDFPHPFDVWLADESPQPQTLRWCKKHGVRISSREGVAAYHRATWPRRTRCKEGNLAYFYDMWGYDLYDVVAQLDADHVPAPDYLRHILVPFHDPDVGYVAAPSICDRNADRSWSARGRLYAEAVLHGPTQAGHSGGCAPSCIGSHYAVRTAALRAIGGLGPELAEDFTTTLMMSAHGWQGVFAVDAEAHGDGPETVADCMTQEFQWSRSMMNVLLGISGRYWRGLSRAAKVRLGFCQLWYPLFGLLMLASVVVPIVAIVTRTPLMRVSLTGFYSHFGPPTGVLVATVFWLRSLSWLRPSTAKAFSWEIALFQLVRWPWALLGCLHAVVGKLARREFGFKVTPKGRAGLAPLPIRVVLPYLLLALVSAAPSLLHLNAGAARGYYTLALINLVLYLTAALAVVALHIHDHPRAIRLAALRSSAGNLLATAGVTLVVIGGIAAPGLVLGSAPSAPRGPGPWPISASVTPKPAVGVTSPALAANSTAAWTTSDLVQVNVFEHTARTHASIVMWFADWQHAHVEQSQLRAIARRGSIPEISWEPWDYMVGLRRPQPDYTLASIIDGRHDAYIRAWAQQLHAYGGPVLLRFAQEMNGDWYPWSESTNGNLPGQFVVAWRHVHDIFTAEHATNVKWVWSPVARYGVALSTTDYPGDAYVDVLGLSGFNGGTALPWTGWRSFSSLFNGSIATLHRLAPSKPIQISEVGSAEAGGDKAAWIANMFSDLRAHPQVTSVVWFDLRKQTDWRINSSPASGQAFATAVAASTPRAAPAALAAPGPTPAATSILRFSAERLVTSAPPPIR
ncbi:MAG TPA: glycosyltransferase [Solirubrobacteraceae bacterium]|nr:glycosyltransferase [Solirubrobacteraceae bacterium]